MARARIKDVARLAGVSVGTVSNVLNRPDLVASPTQERVLAAVRELEFVRNASARSLRVGANRAIGLVVLDVGNPFFTDVARGAQEAADALGMMVMLCSSENEVARQQRHLEMFEQQRVLGVLLTPAGTRDPHVDEMVKRGTPVVLLDAARGVRKRCSVTVDDVMGGRLVVEHLVAQGHQRITFVGGEPSVRQVRDRLRGAQGALPGGAHLAVHPTADLTVAAGREAAKAILASSDRRPTAAFCANDLLALGMLQELTRQRLDVPSDLALVGYDDIEFASAAAVPLSSVRQPRQELGRVAVELLLEEVDEGAAHRHRQVMFTPELVVRDSSRVDVMAGRRPA
ncbi:LacI family DNA-binding transcriptional regulator [Pedococcus sp. 5OH_020]|uniref:LacI family DNA-binding transcriptional regulator n=1 Tax=Pedococcus sp. 5OH_020 TaxID=2989814 RepID=UPI0022E9ECC7|nr:LacI family DNA-binding transcriptional regulator [Pedococcus sp. 5OH_020]